MDRKKTSEKMWMESLHLTLRRKMKRVKFVRGVLLY